MEKLLNDDIINQINDVFGDLKKPVHIMFFGRQDNCQFCDETRQLVEEVAAISDLISIEIYDIDEHEELAKKYNVDKTPNLVIAAMEDGQITDFGVRLAGIPSGHEFTSLIQDIVLVANRDSGLNTQTREFLKEIDKPLLLQVHVTPT